MYKKKKSGGCLCKNVCPMKPVVAERSSALDSSSGGLPECGFESWPVAALVSLSRTLYHNCFILRMERKAVGPVCYMMHVKEPRTLIVKVKGLAPVFLESSYYWCLHCWMCKYWHFLSVILSCPGNHKQNIVQKLFCMHLCNTDFLSVILACPRAHKQRISES